MRPLKLFILENILSKILNKRLYQVIWSYYFPEFKPYYGISILILLLLLVSEPRAQILFFIAIFFILVQLTYNFKRFNTNVLIIWVRKILMKVEKKSLKLKYNVLKFPIKSKVFCLCRNIASRFGLPKKNLFTPFNVCNLLYANPVAMLLNCFFLQNLYFVRVSIVNFSSV